MNKQEAIKLLQEMAKEPFKLAKIHAVHIDKILAKIHAVYIDKIVELVNEIDEPQKPVVPKFVAEWYERNKDSLDQAIYSTITGTHRKLDGENNDLLDTFEGWLLYEYNSILTLVQMHLFGYEIEKEKLYTVEIPDPHGVYKIRYLFRDIEGNIRIRGSDCRDMLLNVEAHLTESEIKKDFEWAWQWAKEVEDELADIRFCI